MNVHSPLFIPGSQHHSIDRYTGKVLSEAMETSVVLTFSAAMEGTGLAIVERRRVKITRSIAEKRILVVGNECVKLW